MCYHITNIFDSWYFMKKGLLSGMKKRILRLINYIFVIAILFGGMCLDKVEAYSSDVFADDVTAGFVSVNSENNRLSSDYKNSTGFYSSMMTVRFLLHLSHLLMTQDLVLRRC